MDLENGLIAAESLRSIFDSLEYHQVSVQPQLEDKRPIQKSPHSEGVSYVVKLVTNSVEMETNPIPFNDLGQRSGISIPSTCYSPDTSACGTEISIQLSSSSSSSSGYSSSSSADIDLQVRETPPAMPEQSQEPASTTMRSNTALSEDSDTATNTTTAEDIDVQFDKSLHLVPYNPHKDESATDEELAPDQCLNSGYVVEGNTIGSTETQHEVIDVTNLLYQEDTTCNDCADTCSEPEQGSDDSNSSEDQHADPQESKYLLQLQEDVASRHPTNVTESGYVWEEHMDTQSWAEEDSEYQADASNFLFQDDMNDVTLRIPTNVSESSYVQEEHFHHFSNSNEGNSEYCLDIDMTNVPYKEAINDTSFPFNESSYVQEEQFRYHPNRNQDGSESNDGRAMFTHIMKSTQTN